MKLKILVVLLSFMSAVASAQVEDSLLKSHPDEFLVSFDWMYSKATKYQMAFLVKDKVE